MLLLNVDGTMVVVGLPEKGVPIGAFSLTPRPHSPAGSEIGGIHEIQEMLDFCSRYGAACDVEVVPIQKVDEAYVGSSEKRCALQAGDRHGIARKGLTSEKHWQAQKIRPTEKFTRLRPVGLTLPASAIGPTMVSAITPILNVPRTAIGPGSLVAVPKAVPASYHPAQ